MTLWVQGRHPCCVAKVVPPTQLPRKDGKCRCPWAPLQSRLLGLAPGAPAVMGDPSAGVRGRAALTPSRMSQLVPRPLLDRHCSEPTVSWCQPSPQMNDTVRPRHVWFFFILCKRSQIAVWWVELCPPHPPNLYGSPNPCTLKGDLMWR